MTIDVYGIVSSSGRISNIILLNSQDNYIVPEGSSLVLIGSSGAGIGWRYLNATFMPPTPPIPTPPTPSQLAVASLVSGLQVTSTSTPAINGTYSASITAITNINAITTYILINNTFPNNQASMPWYDVSGIAHTFTNVTLFKAFATAFANFVAAVQLYADSNGNIGPLPSNQVTIS